MRLFDQSRLTLLAATAATVITLATGSNSWAGGTEKHQEWNWKGPVPAAAKLTLHGINGSIEATPASGNQIEIVADKHAKKHDPSEVEIKVVQDSDGITICAVYPHGGSPCGDRGERHVRSDSDVQVDFTVRVPAGVAFSANTVNGGITAHALNGRVTARTVNGTCDIETSQSGEATTVNGGVRAVLGHVKADDRLKFETVNGNITLLMPEGVGARLQGGTVNGSIRTDYPVTVSGKWGPKSFDSTIGGGGARVSANTVNGSIQVRRSQ